jgi:CHRD domain-containing protein
MKRLTIAACVVALAGCQDNPGAPSDAGTTVLRANIAAASAVPAVTGPEAGGTGTVTITLRTTRENGVITGGTADFAIALTGYPAGTEITAAHIRVGGAAANGALVQDTGLAAQRGATLGPGSGTITVAGVPVSGPVANALVANAGAYYFNVQSELNPGTAARGQLLFP